MYRIFYIYDFLYTSAVSTWSIHIIGLTVYGMVSWQGWTQNIHDTLLILVAFSSGINAIATGALIDMHTMRYKIGKKFHQ